MSDYIQIQWTAAHLDEARDISKVLIMKSLVACVSISPLVESWFVWEDELESASEVKVLMRTKARLFQVIQKIIEKEHSYDVPEILMFRIEQGNNAYLKWIDDQVQTRTR